MTDLRVQLHKKRQQQGPPARKPLSRNEPVYSDDDRDSLEKARISSSDEENGDYDFAKRGKLTVSNRLVQRGGSPRKVIRQEPTKR